jgi:hypothetical protein
VRAATISLINSLQSIFAGLVVVLVAVVLPLDVVLPVEAVVAVEPVELLVLLTVDIAPPPHQESGAGDVHRRPAAF